MVGISVRRIQQRVNIFQSDVKLSIRDYISSFLGQWPVTMVQIYQSVGYISNTERMGRWVCKYIYTLLSIATHIIIAIDFCCLIHFQSMWLFKLQTRKFAISNCSKDIQIHNSFFFADSCALFLFLYTRKIEYILNTMHMHTYLLNWQQLNLI